MLNDLVIPAVYENMNNRTYLFSTFEAKINPQTNYKLYDVLMATTAAPTFFPSYNIENEGHTMEGTFVDGGV